MLEDAKIIPCFRVVFIRYNGSVSTLGQERPHNLNAPDTLHPVESSPARTRRCAAAGRWAHAVFPAEALIPEQGIYPQRETLSYNGFAEFGIQAASATASMS
jgi:hypothetical protein